MSEGPEHDFLKNTFNRTLHQFSSLRLYSVVESERRKFDLSCVIERDWSRPLIGQVAWSHSEGLDKDLRTLLTDTDSEIKAYIAKDTIRHRKAVDEIVGDFRRSERFKDLYRLKMFWIPSDFSADLESDRRTVAGALTEQVVSDLLLNVIFGNLAPREVRLLLVSGGILGLGVAILHYIAVHGFTNITSMVKDLGLKSSTPAREKLVLLHSLELVSAPDMAAYYEPTVKGKVVLELFRRLHEELQAGSLSDEMRFLLERLGCHAMPLERLPTDADLTTEPFVWLMRNLKYSQTMWGISWPELTYERAVRLTVPIEK